MLYHTSRAESYLCEPVLRPERRFCPTKRQGIGETVYPFGPHEAFDKVPKRCYYLNSA